MKLNFTTFDISPLSSRGACVSRIAVWCAALALAALALAALPAHGQQGVGMLKKKTDVDTNLALTQGMHKDTVHPSMERREQLVGIDSLKLQPAWDVRFATIFDNSEGDPLYTPSMTHFLGNLDLAGGLKLDRRGRHLLAAGVAVTVPLGCEWDSTRVSPTLYYRFRKPGVRFDMGMFPRSHLIEEVPSFILSDSARYWQRNIRGAMVGLEHRNGYFQAYIDWRGLQTHRRREAFAIVASGRCHPGGGIIMFGGTGMLNHLAKRKSPPPGEFIVDNMLVQGYLGLNLSRHKTVADSLTILAGPILALTRYRINDEWVASKGVYGAVTYHLGWFGLTSSFTYTGKPLYPYYSLFRSTLNEGEPYYASRYYSRTVVSARLLRLGRAVELSASNIFNLAQNCFQWSQRLIVNVNLGNI